MSFADQEEAAFAEQAKDDAVFADSLDKWLGKDTPERAIAEAVRLDTYSPVPRKPMTMDFYDALKEVSAGKRITKLEWADKGEPECYVLLSEGKLQIYRNGRMHDWLITDGDIAGEDYVNQFHSER